MALFDPSGGVCRTGRSTQVTEGGLWGDRSRLLRWLVLVVRWRGVSFFLSLLGVCVGFVPSFGNVAEPLNTATMGGF